MITFRTKGSFRKTKKMLEHAYSCDFHDILTRYGEEGVAALFMATPEDSGETARSWGYEITQEHGRARIVWTNSNMNQGIPIAILIQYGHATRNGSWVEGRDFINPAIQPIFDKIAEKAWKEVIGS